MASSTHHTPLLTREGKMAIAHGTEELQHCVGRSPLAVRRLLFTANGQRPTANYNHPMHRSTRRLIALAIGLLAFIIGAALLYQFGMIHLEGKPRSFWDSLE